MAHNDFLPVEDNISSKKSVKKQIIWTVVIIILAFFLGALSIGGTYGFETRERITAYCKKCSSYVEDYIYQVSTGAVIVMLITIGLTFFFTLGMLLIQSIDWKEPEKCKKYLRCFHIAILILTICGIAAGITGLVD
ncbi:MAG: hypothetical protein LBL13_11720 [Bacteroidales bacterium]|jgi:hypothetical protein|nr:hypothetical protein [Bacteroidales bacterium]